MLGAVMFGHRHFQPVIQAIVDLAEKAAKEPREHNVSDTAVLDAAEPDRFPNIPPSPPEPLVAQQPEPEPELEDELEPEPEPEPEPQPEPAAFEPNPFEELENADTQLMVLPPAPPSTDPIEPTAELSADSMIMAVVCQFGHNSPQNATLCRDLRQPDRPAGPQTGASPCVGRPPRIGRYDGQRGPCCSGRPSHDRRPIHRPRTEAD